LPYYKIKETSEVLETKIKKEISEMKVKQEKEINTIIKEIEEETKEIIENYYKSKDLKIPDIQHEKNHNP